MKVSHVARTIQPSLTRKLFDLAKKYDDVVDLTLGDSDLNPPIEIREVACFAINSNKLHYSANAGLLEAREAVSKRIYELYSISYNPDDEIILTGGGMEALYLTLLSTVDVGDEIIIFSPYYVNYVQMVEMCGGTPIIINAYHNMKLTISKEEIESVISSKTTTIIINSPNNPTGQMFDRDSLNNIVEIAQERDLLIITDEVYKTLIYDSLVYNSVLRYSGIKDRVILIDSLSKEYSMTGWRIGYACTRCYNAYVWRKE